jgi:fructoselysine-6-P-deglycase FrlB-like protein
MPKGGLFGTWWSSNSTTQAGLKFAGEAVTIVALGGSITAGQGVSVAKDAYIPRLFDWIQSTFPYAQHRYPFKQEIVLAVSACCDIAE